MSTDTYQQALQSHLAGRLHEAESAYQILLKSDPDNGEVLHMLGVLNAQQGRLEQGRQLVQLALVREPNQGIYAQSLGNILTALGNLPEAVNAYTQAFTLNPNDLDSMVMAGATHKKLGNLLAAMDCYEKALALQPNHFELYNNLGNLCKALGRNDQALAHYQQGIALQDHFPEAHYNLSVLLSRMDDLKGAISHCQKAVEQQPDLDQAHAFLGTLYHQKGKRTEAITAYKEAVRLNPSFPKAHHNLALLYQQNHQPDQALAHYQKAVELDPDYGEALQGLGNIVYHHGFYEEAYALLTRAARTRPDNLAWQLRAEGLMPIIPQSAAEITRRRNQLENTLRARLAEPQRMLPKIELNELLHSICEPSFYLSYHGQSDLSIKSLYGDLYMQMFEQHYPHLIGNPVPNQTGKPRIAFLVTDHHENVFCKLMLGYLNGLCRETFDITVICPPESRHYIESRITPNRETSFQPLPEKLETAILDIQAQSYDLIIYFESGSCAMNYFLPFFRLAPVQCTTWGLPNTTGNPQMDYFISGDWVEIPQADSHYRERLVRMKSLPAHFYRPQLPEKLKSRAEIGLPDSGTLYSCPQSLFKLHPDFDPILAGILRKDPNGHLILLAAAQPHWNDLLRKRFEALMPDVTDRIHFLPRLSYENYLSLLNLSDVIVDPLYYSGSITSLEILAFGTPIVTMADDFFRGRVTHACYVGMNSLRHTVHSSEAYIAEAVRLGADPQARQEARNDILARNGILYENPDAVPSLTTFCLHALEQTRTSRGGGD